MVNRALAVIAVAAVAAGLGCRSTMRAEHQQAAATVVTIPQVKVVHVPCRMSKLPPLNLPPWPSMPGPSAGPAAWERWYRAAAAVALERLGILDARVKAQEEIISACSGANGKQ